MLVQLAEKVKAQPRVVCQSWGRQVEDPLIFICSIQWETFEANIAFTNSKGYDSFLAGMGQVFDLQVAPLIICTRMTTIPEYVATDTKNAEDAAPKGSSIALHGDFGYASVDDHIKWRQTPEHA